jgi:thiosulfate dehydrogenase
VRVVACLLLSACAVELSPVSVQAVTVQAVETVSDDAPTERVDFQAELPAVPASDDRATFQPPPRGSYPDGPFGEAVRRGEALFTDTSHQAGQYMGNDLSCSNCHLDDGRRAYSAPMWAAWVKYPAYRKKNDRVNSLEERLQGCFTYSLNAGDSQVGHAPEAGDPVLNDLSTYMYWLSTGAAVGETLPGRGYPKLATPPRPYDAARGALVYAERCVTCHGDDGGGAKVDGKVVFPPLWGDASYNWGAGMHRVNTAAGFIWANMPLGQPQTLEIQQAWDVAAYINSKPRPADPRAGSTDDADADFHAHSCAYGDEIDGHLLGVR